MYTGFEESFDDMGGGIGGIVKEKKIEVVVGTLSMAITCY